MKTDAEWSQKVSRTQYRENSHVSTPGLAHVPRILSLPVDPAAPKAQAFVQKFNYPYTRKEIEKYRAKAANGGDKGGKKELTLPESVQKTIDICKGVFSKDLLPEIIRMRKGRMLFSSEEDALLAIGVSRFGPDDWNEIQAYCLPTRTVRQLKARYTFLISRRAPETDVKRHYLSPIQPLKLIERELLVTGFKQHGAAFQHMLERVFPRYPKALVTRTWDALHAIEQIPVSYAEACEMAPAPVFEDPPPVLRTDVILCRHAHAEVDLYTIAGAGLDYLEQSIRLLQNERNLPSKDLRSRLSKGLQHAVVGGKICPLYAHSRIGPKNTLDVSGAMPKRKVEAIEGLAQQRQKRLRV